MILAQVLESVDSGPEWAVIAAWVAAAAALASIPANLWISGRRLGQAEEESTKRMQQERDLHREQLLHEASESEKRLAHEERMLETRLVHERREVLKVTAARTLRTSFDFLRLYYKQQVQRSADVDDADLRAVAADSIQALAEIGAWGWTEEVKSAAERVEVLLSFLPYTVLEDAPIRQDRKARDAHRATLDALNDFRKAMALEVSE